MTNAIIIEETGNDWEPTTITWFYAQRQPKGLFEFGATEAEALANLLKAETNSERN